MSEKKKAEESDSSDLPTTGEGSSHTHQRTTRHHHHRHKNDSEEDSEKKKKKKLRQKDSGGGSGILGGALTASITETPDNTTTTTITSTTTPANGRHHRRESSGTYSQSLSVILQSSPSSPSSPIQHRRRGGGSGSGTASTAPAPATPLTAATSATPSTGGGGGSMTSSPGQNPQVTAVNSAGLGTSTSSVTVIKSPDVVSQRRCATHSPGLLLPQQQQQPPPPPALSLSGTPVPTGRRGRIVLGSARARQCKYTLLVSPVTQQQTGVPLQTISGGTKSSSFKFRTPSPTVLKNGISDNGIGASSGNSIAGCGYGEDGSQLVSVMSSLTSIVGTPGPARRRKCDGKRLSVYDWNKGCTDGVNVNGAGGVAIGGVGVCCGNGGIMGTVPMLTETSTATTTTTTTTTTSSTSTSSSTTTVSTPKTGNLRVQLTGGVSGRRPSVLPQARGSSNSNSSSNNSIGRIGGDRKKRVQSETFSKADLFKSFNESWVLLVNKCEVYVNMKTLSLSTTFEIRVSKGITEPWTIIKSFKQFYELDVELRYEFANLSIPKLPNKSVFKLGCEDGVSEKKAKELGKYLDEISQNSKITNSQTFEAWVAKGSNIVRELDLKAPDVYGFLYLVLTHTRKVSKLFVLASPILFFYDSDISEFLDSCKKAIWLGNAKLSLLGGDSNIFAVQSQNGSSFILEPQSKEDADKWITKISEAIKQTSNALIPKHTWKRAGIPHRVAVTPDGSSPANEAARDTSSANSSSMRSTGSIHGEDSEDPYDVSEGGGSGSYISLDEYSNERVTYSPNGTLTPGGSETPRVKLFTAAFERAKKEADNSLRKAVAVLKEAQKSQEHAGDEKFVKTAQRLARRCEKIVKSTPRDLTSSDLLRKTTTSLRRFGTKYKNVKLPRALYDISALSRLVEAQSELAPTSERKLRHLSRTYSQSAIVVPPAKPTQLGQPKMPQKHIPYCSHKHNLSTLPGFSRSTSDLESFVKHIHPQALQQHAYENSDEEDADRLGGSDVVMNGSDDYTNINNTITNNHKCESVKHYKEKKELEESESGHTIEPEQSDKIGSDERVKPSSASGDSYQEVMEDEEEEVEGEDEEGIKARNETYGESGGEEEGPSGKKDKNSMIMCRICEEEYPRYLLQEHAGYCAFVENLVPGDMACDKRIELLIDSLAEQREAQTQQYPNIDTSPYIKIDLIGRAVAGLQYGSEDAMRRCFNLLSELHWYLDNGTYDLLLLAYGKKLIKVIEEKYNVMKEFLRVHTKNIDSLGSSSSSSSLSNSGTGQGRKGRKKGNFWGILMFMKPGRVESETIKAINSDYSSRIKIADFKLIKKISSGAYGKVFLARKNKTNDLYAVKILKKEDTLRKNMTDNVIAERKILSSINNPFVVNLYYAFQSKEDLYLVMEYYPGGDVGTLLKNLGAFDLEMTRTYAAETVLALESLHKLNFVHRDLKPDNLLISATGHIVLTDFGLSTWGVMMGDSSKAADNTKHKLQQEHRVFGTPDYLAPEILLGAEHGPEVDWWALGVMVFEFITSVPPFNDDSPEKIFNSILDLRIPWPSEEDGFPPVARDFIERLLVLDPKKRLGHNGAAEIKEHPFFEGINWDTLIYESREDIFVPCVDNPEDTSYFEDHGSVNDPQLSKTRSSEELEEMEAETAAMMFAEAAAENYGAQKKLKKPTGEDSDVGTEDDFNDFEYTNTELIMKKTLELAQNGPDDDDDDDDNNGDTGNDGDSNNSCSCSN